MALVAAAAQAGQPPTAAQGRPLPSFTVVTPDGRTVGTADLTGEPQWVLVYVRPGGAVTRKLLASVAGWQPASAPPGRVVLVVGAPAETAAGYLAKEVGSSSSGWAWYADPDGRAARALGFAGAPALVGVREGAASWTLTGVLNEPSKYESVVRTWIGAAPAVR